MPTAQVRFLKDVEKELLVALAFHVSAKVFPPQEICPQGVLYIVHKGVALYQGRMVTSGQSWGEDLLMKDPSMVGNGHGIAISYLSVYTLDGKVIRECLSLYPESTKKVQRTTMRWMMARMMVKAARVVKEFRSESAEAKEQEPLHILKESRTLKTQAKRGDADDGMSAAMRFAAREAVRQSQALSEADRLVTLEIQMKQMMELLQKRLPPEPKDEVVQVALPPEVALPLPGQARDAGWFNLSA